MKIIISFILASIINPVHSQNLIIDNSELIQNFEKNCKYFFGDKIKNLITFQKVDKFIFNDIDHQSFEFHLKIKLNKKITEAKLEFTCPSKIVELPTKMPEQIIKEEDAGGRYFRHVAWQREIHGNNWQGIIAYSDYLFGDSEKIPTYDYLVCQKYSQCFSYSINTDPKLNAHEIESALGLLKTIKFSK